MVRTEQLIDDLIALRKGVADVVREELSERVQPGVLVRLGREVRYVEADLKKLRERLGFEIRP